MSLYKILEIQFASWLQSEHSRTLNGRSWQPNGNPTGGQRGARGGVRRGSRVWGGGGWVVVYRVGMHLRSAGRCCRARPACRSSSCFCSMAAAADRCSSKRRGDPRRSLRVSRRASSRRMSSRVSSALAKEDYIARERILLIVFSIGQSGEGMFLLTLLKLLRDSEHWKHFMSCQSCGS